MAKITIKEITIGEVNTGVPFTLHEYEGVYMVSSPPADGFRQTLELSTGKTCRLSCSLSVTTYPDAEIILKAKS